MTSVSFFKTKSIFYLYEPYNNNIYKISDLAYRIMPLLMCGKTPIDIEDRFKGHSNKKRINTFLNNYSRHGIFGYLLRYHTPIKFLNPLHIKKNIEKFNTNISHIILNVTDSCNLRCKYCILSELYPTEKNFSNLTMDWDIARSSVKFLKDHSAKPRGVSISFYGGEPLLKFKLIKKVVSYAKRIFKDKKLYFHITTNGTLLDKEKCKFLMKNGFYLIISLDGPRKVHDRYRVYINGAGSFDNIIKNMNILRSLDKKYFRKNVSFITVMAPHYKFRDIEDFFVKDLSIGPDRVITTFVSGVNTKFYKKFPENDKDQYEFYRLYSRFIKDRGRRTEPPTDLFSKKLIESEFLNIFKRSRSNIYKTTGFPRGQCLPGIKKLYIETNGDFHMCEKVEHTCPIGNVYSGFDMERINKLFDEYYNDAAKTCSKCWAMRLCELCMAEVLKKGKFDRENKRKFCRHQRRSLKRQLRIYCSILEENPKAFDYMKKIKIT